MHHGKLLKLSCAVKLNRNRCIHILLLVSTLLMAFYTPPSNTALLALAKKYLPDNLLLLETCEPALLKQLAKTDSTTGYLFKLPLLVHEAYHAFENKHQEATGIKHSYRVNDTLSISISNFP